MNPMINNSDEYENVPDMEMAFRIIAGDRTVNYKLAFGRLFGLVTGVFLSQLVYWDVNVSGNRKRLLTLKNGRKVLCWYHSDEEIMLETNMTPGLLRTAKRELKQAGVLHTVKHPYRNYYYIDYTQLTILLVENQKNQLCKNRKTSSVKLTEPVLLNLPNILKEYKKENIKENSIAETAFPPFSSDATYPDENLDLSTQSNALKANSLKDKDKNKNIEALSVKPKPTKTPVVDTNVVAFILEKFYYADSPEMTKLLQPRDWKQINDLATFLKSNDFGIEHIRGFWNWFLKNDFRGKQRTAADLDENTMPICPTIVRKLFTGFLTAYKANPSQFSGNDSGTPVLNARQVSISHGLPVEENL